MLFGRTTPVMVTADQALPGRAAPVLTPEAAGAHTVLGTPLFGHPEGMAVADFALGCFWGAERKFWQLPAGVWTTLVGYQGGFTENPTYEEVCSGLTGHTETVRVVYDPDVLSYEALLKTFWESHDPTQGYRQGNDVGTQYRSAVFTHTPEQAATAEASRAAYQQVLAEAGYGSVTTEIEPAAAHPFYPAELYHQQYLSDAKNPNGYCGIGGTGLSCPVGVAAAPDAS
ncbi:peptide-methionine (S)-S-oxide reductase MsrA [Streptomyces sp. NPDC002734]|uniref:peptide-methionine (S)-S-oxide reductase MsrA n=1 Tax=Streptomyces sp. NPDC002734 TaxID=3154426 RepID=UPI00332C4E24